MDEQQSASVTKPSPLKSTAWYVLGIDLAAAAIVWAFRTDIFKVEEPATANDVDVPALIVSAALLGLGVISFLVLTTLGNRQQKIKSKK